MYIYLFSQNFQRSMDNFHNLMSYYNKILTILGLNCVKLDNSNGKSIYKICFLSILYSILLLIFWASSFYVAIIKQLMPDPYEKDLLTKLFILATNLLGVVCSFLLIFFNVYNPQKYCDILTNYNINLLDHQDYKYLKRRFTVHSMVLLFIFVMIFTYTMVAYGRQYWGDSEYLKDLFYDFIWFAFSVYSLACCSHFSAISKWIAVHFAKLNEALKKISFEEKINEVEQFDGKKFWVSAGYKKVITLKGSDMVRCIFRRRKFSIIIYLEFSG